MKNYLKVEIGSRGMIEGIEWVKNKSFDEIVSIGWEEFENNREFIVGEFREDGNEEEGLSYVGEWCEFVKKEDIGVEMSMNEEEGVGYYNEDLVKELVGLDLNDEKNFDLINEVVDRVLWSVES